MDQVNVRTPSNVSLPDNQPADMLGGVAEEGLIPDEPGPHAG